MGALPSLAASAPKQPAGNGYWYRFPFADRGFAAAFLCQRDDLEFQQDAQKPWTAIRCQKAGLEFLALQGGPSSVPGHEGEVLTFQQNLALAQQNLSPGQLRQFEVGGHRAFAVNCPENNTASCFEVIDMAPDKPLTLIARRQDSVALSLDTRAKALAEMGRFYTFLEILAK